MRITGKRNKYGNTTIFTAIILSALILIECTYLVFVWDLDRRMEVSRALKCEVDSILAEYNRQLFSVYGIYAFELDDVDDRIFDNVLESNGLHTGQAIEIDGVEVLDTDSLRQAISSYYSYRGGAVAVGSLLEQVSGLLASIDDKGVMGKIRSFTNSSASKYLKEVLTDSDKVSEALESVKEKLEGTVLNQGLDQLSDLYALIDDNEDDVTLFGDGASLYDLRFLVEGYSTLESLTSKGSKFISGKADHLLLAHYAAYNFDCAVDNENDCSINGTAFSGIHDKNYYDAEYIMTGADGRFGFVSVSSLMLQLMFCKHFLDIFSDPAQSTAYEALSILLSSLIAVISGGTLDIPTEVMKLIVVSIVAIGKSVKDYKDVMKGGKFALLEENGADIILLGYRDFLFLYLACTADIYLLSRSLEVLRRDYGEMYTGIRLVTTYRGTDYDVTKRYALYE
ncbi:hypothetical protein SAMN02910456_00219 [Ruminococcaceae bacterium YRB3002]|nr:hypothetical protein SAMN02910456_00219 [Ruminococcaceae bacterium YRB3002]